MLPRISKPATLFHFVLFEFNQNISILCSPFLLTVFHFPSSFHTVFLLLFLTLAFSFYRRKKFVLKATEEDQDLLGGTITLPISLFIECFKFFRLYVCCWIHALFLQIDVVGGLFLALNTVLTLWLSLLG
jgi:hypothetical protein